MEYVVYGLSIFMFDAHINDINDIFDIWFFVKLENGKCNRRHTHKKNSLWFGPNHVNKSAQLHHSMNECYCDELIHVIFHQNEIIWFTRTFYALSMANKSARNRDSVIQWIFRELDKAQMNFSFCVFVCSTQFRRPTISIN